jgi:hypothetical protein
MMGAQQPEKEIFGTTFWPFGKKQGSLHRIERLMREQALGAKPRRRGLPRDAQNDDLSLEVPAFEQFVHALRPLRHRSRLQFKGHSLPGAEIRTRAPEPFASTVVPCQQVEEWLYECGPGQLVATVFLRSGVVQSITYGRQPR